MFDMKMWHSSYGVLIMVVECTEWLKKKFFSFFDYGKANSARNRYLYALIQNHTQISKRPIKQWAFG